MKLRDRIFLWRNGYCLHHLEPRQEMYGFTWCDLCQEEEAQENALKTEAVLRRAEHIKAKS